MTFLLYASLFAVLQNIDNFVLAAAYRLQSVKITAPSNLLIAALSAVFTEAAVLAAGCVKIEATRGGWSNYTEIIGRGILVMIGVWTLVGYFRLKFFSQLQKAPADSVDHFLPLTPMKNREAIVVGTALGIDNLGPSFAFGLVNFQRPGAGLVLAAFTALVSIALVLAGDVVVVATQRRVECVSPKLVAGCLIVGLAFFDPGDLASGLFK
jgi:putative Mn2+ efflux pump MntP